MEENSFRNQQTKDQGAKPFWGGHLFFTLIVVGVFLIGAFGVYFWQRGFVKDELVNFAPVDTAVYFYARNSTWPWQEEILNNLPYDNFYREDFTQKLLSLSTHTAYLKIFIDNKFESVWLFKLKQPTANASFAFEFPDFKVYNDKILIISDSTQALEKIDKVVSGQTFSLATQLQNNNSKDQIKLFISAQNLKNYFNQQGLESSKILSQLLTEDLYISFSKDENTWQLKFNKNLSNNQFINPKLISSLPKDFDVFISQINLSKLFSQWSVADDSFSETLQQTNKVYQKIFNTDLSDIADGILNAQSDVIIFTQDKDTAFGIGYVLISKKPNDAEISSFENFIKIILSQKLPQKAIRYLPDGTSVMEFSANINAWQWQIEDVEGLNITYLVEPELDFAIYYTLVNDVFYVANSKIRLLSVLQGEGIALSDYIKSCPISIFDSNYVILAKDSQIPQFSSFIPAKTIVLGQNMGCILNF